MLVVDASVLYDVVTGAPRAEPIRERLAADADQVAPHVIDVEVLSVIRRHHFLGLLDNTAAAQAVDELHDWPGERVGHRPLLYRAWELRATVRGWDAMYVALAEAVAAPLLTIDTRLAAAPGPTCEFELIG